MKCVTMIAALVAALLGAANPAQATPILATVSGAFSSGPLAGPPFAANFGFDLDLSGVPPGTVGTVYSAINAISITVGSSVIYSSQNPGAVWLTTVYPWGWGPGVSEFFGTDFQVPTAVLVPLGLTYWQFSIDPVHAYGWSTGAALDDCSVGPCRVTAIIGAQVPEPSSLALLMSLTGVIAMHRAFRKSRAMR